jgi:CRP-like cAMP-binding protein
VFIDIFNSNLKSDSEKFGKGDKIFTQGATVENVYFVTSGRVKLIRENLEGNSLVIHVAYAGESFAEASLFSNQYHCHGVADCASEVVSFNKKQVLTFLQENPTSMMALINALAGQIRDLRLLSEIKSIYSAKDRIMAFLQSEAKENMFYYTYSLTDLAHKIGLAQETLYRKLATLETENKIIKQDGCIKLIN